MSESQDQKLTEAKAVAENKNSRRRISDQLDSQEEENVLRRGTFQKEHSFPSSVVGHPGSTMGTSGSTMQVTGVTPE